MQIDIEVNVKREIHIKNNYKNTYIVFQVK